MPRFMDTHTGEFVLKNDPATARYAILSHTWRSEANGGEQTYDVVIELQRQSRLSPLRRDGVASCAPCPCQSCGGALSVSPLLWHRDSKLSDKIKGICKVAREAGYKLLWVDSCCIDKSSSAELSEAIKSMWEWYSLADLCYVYLEDVHHAPGSAKDLRFGPFGASQWHRRGWTLQELIAPDDVVFMTRRWEVFGTKIGLAETLDQITGIDVSILTGQVDIRSVSVACRMSWAAKRKTTRVEDQAYCLMGIFGVHITPIYGEGTNAFLRLQEEIIRTIADQSIFAWGYANCTAQNPYEGRLTTGPSLLAQSSADFEGCRDIVSLSPSSFISCLGEKMFQTPPLHCIFTPEGIRVQLLCVQLTDLPDSTLLQSLTSLYNDAPCELRVYPPRPTQTKPVRALAFLRCQAKDFQGSLIVLPLFSWKESEEKRLATFLNTLDLSTSGQDDTPDHVLPHTLCLPSHLILELLKYVLPQPIKLLLPRPDHSLPVAESYSTLSEVPRLPHQFWAHLRNIGISPSPSAARWLHYTPISIMIHSRCRDDLLLAGFAISELRFVTLSPSFVELEFALLTLPNPKSETPRELIKLGVALWQYRPQELQLLSFSSYYLFCQGDIQKTEAHRWSWSNSLTLSAHRRPSRTTQVSRTHTSPGVLVEASYIVDTVCAGTDATVSRYLRLGISKQAEDTSTNSLALRVEISEPYEPRTPLTTEVLRDSESEAGTEPGLHGIEEWERYVEDIETGFLDLPALEYDTPLGTAVNTRLPRIDQILGQVPRIDHTYVPEVKQSNNITLSGAVDMARTTYEFHSTDSEHHESGPSTPSSTHSSLPHTASQHTNDSEFLMHDEIPPSPTSTALTLSSALGTPSRDRSESWRRVVLNDRERYSAAGAGVENSPSETHLDVSASPCSSWYPALVSSVLSTLTEPINCASSSANSLDCSPIPQLQDTRQQNNINQEDIGHRGFESSVLGIHYEDEAGPPYRPPDVSPPIAAWDSASVPGTGATRHGLSWRQVVLDEDVDNWSTPPGAATEQTSPELPSGDPSFRSTSESWNPISAPLSESCTGHSAPTSSNASFLHEDTASNVDESHQHRKAIEALKSENDAMRAQMSTMAAQMATVSAQLEVLASAAAGQRASTPGPPAFLRSVRKIFRRFSKRQDGRA